MSDDLPTGLYCESCKRAIVKKDIMRDGFTTCCGANTLTEDDEVVVLPNEDPGKET